MVWHRDSGTAQLGRSRTKEPLPPATHDVDQGMSLDVSPRRRPAALGPLVEMAGAFDLHAHAYPSLFPRLSDRYTDTLAIPSRE